MINWFEKQNLPMTVTYFRIVLSIPIIGFMFFESTWVRILAAVLFIVASVTDYYDGYFARKYNAISNLGKFMDPVADKILVTSILIMLLKLGQVDVIMVLLILARDTFVGGLRSVAAADQFVIAAQQAGKVKTALQMGSIPVLILNESAMISMHLPTQLTSVAYYCLWVSVGLSVYSGIEYVLAYKKGKELKLRGGQ